MRNVSFFRLGPICLPFDLLPPWNIRIIQSLQIATIHQLPGFLLHTW